MTNFKSHFVSACVTLSTVFLGTFAVILHAIPSETWQSPEVYTTAFWFAIIIAVLRGMIRPLVALFVTNYYK